MALKAKGNQQNVNDLVNTYESRFRAIKEDLNNINDQRKRNAIKANMKNLDQLSARIAPQIPNAVPEIQEKYDYLSSEYADMKGDIEQRLAQAESQSAEEEKHANNQSQDDYEARQRQEQIDRETAEVEQLNRETEQIVQDMKAIDDAANILNEKIQEQHEQIIRIDDTIEDAHEEMVEGNKDLNVAQEHQKKSTKCLLYICGGVLIFIIIVAIIIGVSVSKKKK